MTVDGRRRRFLSAALLGAAGLVLAGCPPSERRSGPGRADRPLRVVATTGAIADTLRNIGADRVDVTLILRPGADAHTYRASAEDMRALEGADIVFHNGLELESGMADLIERTAQSGKPVIAVTRDIPEKSLRRPAGQTDRYDPHVWFDLSLWRQAVKTMTAELSRIDPGKADPYQQNAEAFLRQMNDLDTFLRNEARTIPEPRRMLITAHDAFGYLGRRYGLDVRSVHGISTADNAGAREPKTLAELIASRGIKAVFIESSVPRASVEAVQAAVRAGGGKVALGGELHSDALGPEGTPEGTYLGTVRYNVDTIVKALR